MKYSNGVYMWAVGLGLLGFVIPGCKKSQPMSIRFEKETPEIFVQLGHTSMISSVCFSPDGAYAVSGSQDHTMKMWEVKTGRLVRTIRGADIGVKGDRNMEVAFSDDGRSLLVGSWDGDAVVLNLETGTKIAALQLGAMAAMAITPDGGLVFAGSIDGRMKLWNVAGNKDEAEIEPSSMGITAAAFSPDGTTLLTGESKGALQIRDARSADIITTCQDARDTAKICVVAFSPDGKRALSVNDGGRVVSWDVQTGKKIRQFPTEPVRNLDAAAFSRDGRFLATPGHGLDSLSIWDLSRGELFKKIGGITHTVVAVKFSPDGSLVMLGGSHNSVNILRVDTGEEWKTFSGQERFAKGVASTPAENTILSGSVEFFKYADLTINTWDGGHGLLTRQLKGAISSEVSFSLDGRSAFSHRVLWDLASGAKVREFTGMETPNTSTFSKDGKYVLAGNDGGMVSMWEIATGKELLSFKAHSSNVWVIECSPDGRYFATGSYDDEENLKVWDLYTGKLIRAFGKSTGSISTLAFTPDGNFVLASNPGSDGSSIVLTLWDISTGDAVKSLAGHTGGVCGVAVSADGRFALSAGGDGTVRLWDMATASELKTMAGHTGPVVSVAFTADGQHAVSTSDDGTTRLWNLSTGEEIAQFVGFEDGEWVVITPAGYFNASPHGASHLNVRIGNAVYSADNFFEKYFNPAYVAEVLGGRPVPAIADIRKGILTPPRVKFLSPRPNTESASDTISIAVSAKDMTGGIDEIRLYQNGKAIGEESRGMKPVAGTTEQVRTFTVSLVDGNNVFKATGFSNDRTESNPVELVVILAAPRQDVSLHVVAVGINAYTNPALNLNYAEPDARGIADFFRRSGRGLFKTVNIRELYNEQATKQNVVSALRELAGTNPQDAVVIYLAGHGESLNDQWYFIPHELTYPEREEEVKAKAISSDELRKYVNGIKAQKVLILLDACKSGGALVAFRGFEDRKALSQLSRSAGVHVVAASTSNQLAAEVKELGHGVFTYTLLAGLNGKAAGPNGSVTVRKLMGYLEETLPEMTKKYRQEAQYPVVDSRGMDFPLVMAR